MKVKRGLAGNKFNAFDVVNYIVLSLFALLAFYPFLYTIAGSLNDAQDAMKGPIWLIPRKFTWASYNVVLSDKRLYSSFFNTLTSTVITLFIALLLTSCIAYAVSNKRLRCKKFFWLANLITMFIHGGMIPSYMVIVLTGLYDSFWVYVVPSCYSVFNMIVLSNFFKSIDDSLYEAAVVDGAGEIRIWLQIFMPLAKPALATVGLWIAVSKWNSYMPTMLYTSKRNDIWLLQYYLMRLIREGDLSGVDGKYYGEVSSGTLSFAAIIISTIPVLLAYPFVAKFFSKGIMMGSLKG